MYPMPKHRATHLTILRDGPSIGELSQTRPYELELSLPFPVRDGTPQTNNGEHNENQYTHE